MTHESRSLHYNPQGLIPAIVQDHLTGQVRMLAWMNEESLERTIESKMATFYSRSRQKLWVKGAESGNVLHVVDVRADCDRDTLLVLVDPAGPSCHTGAENCFFEPIVEEKTAGTPAMPLLDRLMQTVIERKNSSAEKSYTRSLLDKGPATIGKKNVEEAFEFGVALAHESDDAVLGEGADILFHLLVGLAARDLTLRQVMDVLSQRFGMSGHDEKASRAHRP